MRFILTILLLNCVTAYSQQDKVFGSIEQAFITPAEVETLKVVCTVPENGTKEIDSLKKYIDRFEHLKYLSISECGGKLGQIPKCVTKLKELKRLDFFYNEINRRNHEQ